MKSSKEIEREIAELDAQIAPLNEQLDSAVEEFAALLPHIAQRWMDSAVKRKIEDHSEQVMAKGAEYAKAVKSDLNELYSHLEQISRDAVGPKERWPHNRKVESAHSGVRSRPHDSFFGAAFRSVIGHLGGVLDKHGLLASPRGHVSDWERVGTGFRYSINPGFDERQIEPIARYNQIRIRQDDLASKASAKNTELLRAKASQLWDEA